MNKQIKFKTPRFNRGVLNYFQSIVFFIKNNYSHDKRKKRPLWPSFSTLLRGSDLNREPPGYGPGELPIALPRYIQSED